MAVRTVILPSHHRTMATADLVLAAIRLRELGTTDDDTRLAINLWQSRERLRDAEEYVAPEPVDTVKIRFEIHADDMHNRGEVELPAWTSGDPRMAVALYFLGHSTSVSFVTRAEVVNEPLASRGEH